MIQLKNINLFCLPSLSYGYNWCREVEWKTSSNNLNWTSDTREGRCLRILVNLTLECCSAADGDTSNCTAQLQSIFLDESLKRLNDAAPTKWKCTESVNVCHSNQETDTAQVTRSTAEKKSSSEVTTIPFSSIIGFVLAVYDSKCYLAYVVTTYPDSQELN